MITKQEYLNAIDIVEEYHKQLEKEIVNHVSKFNDVGLKRGDYILYIGGCDSRYLTKNKPYRLTGTPYRNKICIINDKGARMRTNQRYFIIIERQPI